MSYGRPFPPGGAGTPFSEGPRTRREATVARDEALPTDTDIVERMETSQRLTAAVLELPVACRAVIYRRFYEGLDTSEIAERGRWLGCGRGRQQTSDCCKKARPGASGRGIRARTPNLAAPPD
jgi:hypothetical protein